MFLRKVTPFVALVSVTEAMEPFVLPIALQTSQQASLPNVVTINYDVPNAGLSKELAAMKGASSFLGMPKTDVFYENPASPAVFEQEYQNVRASVCEKISTHFKSLNHQSFIKEAPLVKFTVDQHAHNKNVDLNRLTADAYACASKYLASSFLGMHGDELPRPLPVLDIDIPVKTSFAAIKPTFELGEKIGETLSKAISEGTASMDFSSKEGTNPKIQEVVDNENKKYGSFLERPLLNLHVAETHGSFLEDFQREGVEMTAAKQAADYYAALLDLGGAQGTKGISGLLKLASLPNAKAIMNLSTILFKASKLAKRESTSDETRNMCGSLITFLTGMPVAFQSSDASTGSYGHTNVIVPSPSRVYGSDQTISGLAAGAKSAYYN